MTVISPSSFLVADIGGTNARFAIADADGQGRPTLAAIRELRASEYPTLAAAAGDYLASLGTERPRTGVFAVASPVTSDAIRFTNSPWSFSVRALQTELALEALVLINDFAAVAHAVANLRRDDVRAIGVDTTTLAGDGGDGHYVVLGPGTGLGVGALARRGGVSIVIETEGGHVGFAPGNAYELKLLEALWRDHPRISAERLLSGQGLLNLYRAVCAVDGEPASVDTPEQISRQAAAAPESACGRSVALFCELLGAFAGDAVLMHGAWGGVYLAGGITQKLLPWIERGGFRGRFESKGRFETLMKRVPVLAITHPQPGLLGAAARGLLARPDR
ncbi:glucokinase [Solimonas terrae]|uniref:Glucokinase n=1 Tax=Solimonas terrae TaxID=1396819 RepID=A0A6M2BWY9_9GAMM|nr:glucokinase [Solimonas terrae]NGY06805.1 glucokinase [Solimonas terrae]